MLTPATSCPQRINCERLRQRALNDVDPQAWLADALARIADHPASRLDELLPWRWSQNSLQLAA
jgi:hypothetical protein